MKARRWLSSTAFALLLPLAHAQDFPTKPVKIVVPFTAGSDICGAEQRRAHGRARAARASTSDSWRLFEHSERSERSEFRRGPCDRGVEGSRPAGPTAAHERRCIPGRGFASLGPTKQT